MLDWIESGEKSVKEAKGKTEREVAEHLNFKTFYISIEGKDPSDDFVARFKALPRVIKKVSASEIDKVNRLAVVGKGTHQPGIIFYVQKLRWQSDDVVDIEGGYHCDGLCAAGITFHLKLIDGRWRIQSQRMNWVS